MENLSPRRQKWSRVMLVSNPLPSGIHSSSTNPSVCSVSFRGAPPPAGITQTCLPPSRSLTKAICFPSGDQAGCRSTAGWRVNCRAAPPLIGADQTSPFQKNATCLPFGETAKSEANRIGTPAKAKTGNNDTHRMNCALLIVAEGNTVMRGEKQFN